MERQHFVHVVAYGVAWGGFETVVTHAAQCDLAGAEAVGKAENADDMQRLLRHRFGDLETVKDWQVAVRTVDTFEFPNGEAEHSATTCLRNFATDDGEGAALDSCYPIFSDATDTGRKAQPLPELLALVYAEISESFPDLVQEPESVQFGIVEAIRETLGEDSPLLAKARMVAKLSGSEGWKS